MMINICRSCGEYRADKKIDPSGPVAICPICHFEHPFRQLPLLIICGPGGAGKSTVFHQLIGTLDEVVILDGDILWRPEFDKPEDEYRDFFETWLRLAKNISQSGRPLVLIVAGAIPQNIEFCVERRYFSQTHYLALISDDAALSARLERRRQWRNSSDDAFISQQLSFNRCFREESKYSVPKIELIDTTYDPIDQTVERVTAWITERVSKDK